MKNSDKFNAVMSLIQGDKILINEVRKYPYIYDQKHEHYKDTKLKEQTWNAIGDAIKVKPVDAKNRWRNLRDRYVREKKLLITEGEDVYRRHEVWPYLDDMSFLWSLIVHRKNGVNNNGLQNGGEDVRKPVKMKATSNNNNVRNIPSLIPKQMQDWINFTSQFNAHVNNLNVVCNAGIGGASANEDIIEVDPWALSVHHETTDSSLDGHEDFHPSQSKLRKLLLENQVQEDSRENTPNSSTLDYSSSYETNGHNGQKIIGQKNGFDEDEMFCLSVAASLKRFSSKTKAATKIRIQQLLYEAEFQFEECSSSDNRGKERL